MGRRGGGARLGATTRPPPRQRNAVETLRLDFDGQTGCGTPPCRRRDSAVESSASARRARACPSVEAGLLFDSPGSREPVSSNAEPHHTEPSFTQTPGTPQAEPSRRTELPKLCRLIDWSAVGFCVGLQARAHNYTPGPPGAAESSQKRTIGPPLAPPARGLATRLSGPKDAGRTRARAALGHATSSDHDHGRSGPLHRHEGAARVS